MQLTCVINVIVVVMMVCSPCMVPALAYIGSCMGHGGTVACKGGHVGEEWGRVQGQG
jgi:hypothetical protein